MRSLPVALLLLATALSGCGDGGPRQGGEVVAFSVPVEEVTANGTSAPAAEIPKAGTRGHIAGVVVDAAIRPIAGATVRIPGLDFSERTRRDGAFAFADLRPGPYFLTANATGFQPAQVEVEVREDEFVRVKFVMTAIPPPEPWHQTQSFEGYAEMTSMAIAGGWGFLCATCDFEFYAGGPGFRGLTVEAVADGEGTTAFYHSLGAAECCETYASGEGANPLHRIVAAESLPEGESQYGLRIEPESFPAPQTAVAFEVFVTAWHNQDPPTDWSFVGGDT